MRFGRGRRTERRRFTPRSGFDWIGDERIEENDLSGLNVVHVWKFYFAIVIHIPGWLYWRALLRPQKAVKIFISPVPVSDCLIDKRAVFFVVYKKTLLVLAAMHSG